MFEKFYRALFFSIFSAIGVLAVAIAVLGPEWKGLYKIKAAAIQSDRNNQKISQLLTDHQELINLINTDPNILRRLAQVELGVDPNDPNTISAQITSDYLYDAKAVLEQPQDPVLAAQQTPDWLLRATLKSSRIVLFAAGAGLILVSFVCFSAPDRKTDKA
ncbi:MAG: hypothetical protein ABFD79_07670 [Phycisphaerales bacterium]